MEPFSPGALAKLWITLRVSVSLTPPDGAVIGRGNSSERALSGDETPRSRRNGTDSFHLSPFSVDCVGIVPDVNVNFRLIVKRTVAYERVVLLTIGLLLLFLAPRLAR